MTIAPPKTKQHAADKMTAKIEQVGEVDDLVRAGEYEAAIELSRRYGFVLTKELQRTGPETGG
jgi:hypothetical protein